MAMFHHDSRNAQDAVNEARERFRTNIQRDSQKAARGFQALQERVIQDSLTPLASSRYELAGNNVLINGLGITHQAFGQLCTRVAPLKAGFMRELLSHDSQLVRNLAVENLETLSAVSDQTIMLRAVNGVVHGAVSDAFKRMDTNLIVGTFAEQFRDASLLPVQCDVSATRTYVRALMPRLYGEQYGEALAFGLELRASDFGFGKVELNPFVQRVWCSNNAIMTLKMGRGFSKTHRGARLTEETFALSAQTQHMQALAMAGELRDGVRGLLAPEAIGDYVNAIGRCFAEGQRGGHFQAEQELEKLVKARQLSDKAAKFVTDVYASKDRDVVPALDGRWKLAQAIAYAAQHMSDLDVDARVELEYLAGEVVDAAPAGALLASAN